jgi:membrane protease YdiL (CAAX protease family)
MRSRAPLAIQLALCLVPLVSQVVAQGIADVVLRPSTNAATAAYTPAYGVTILMGYVGLLAGTAWTVRELGVDCALVRPELPRAAALAIAAFVLMIVAFIALEPIFGGAHAQQQHLNPTSFPGGVRAGIAIALVALVLIVIGPFCEELYFRGLLFGTLGGTWLAVVIQAAVFAALHLIPAALPVLFIDGLVLGWLRRRTASLWPGVAVHATNNALALALALWT